jgi:hypothetical protein
MWKPLIKTFIILFAVTVAQTNVTGPRALGDDASKVFRPSDLKPPCIITHVGILGSDITLGYITLEDKRGYKLSYWCSIGSSGFENEDHHWVASHPGDSEEALFLKLMKEAYARSGDPKIGVASFQAKVKIFFDLLEKRCATKKEGLGK